MRLCPAVLSLLALVLWSVGEGLDSRGCYASARGPAGSDHPGLRLLCTLQILRCLFSFFKCSGKILNDRKRADLISFVFPNWIKFGFQHTCSSWLLPWKRSLYLSFQSNFVFESSVWLHLRRSYLQSMAAIFFTGFGKSLEQHLCARALINLLLHSTLFNTSPHPSSQMTVI